MNPTAGCEIDKSVSCERLHTEVIKYYFWSVTFANLKHFYIATPDYLLIMLIRACCQQQIKMLGKSDEAHSRYLNRIALNF